MIMYNFVTLFDINFINQGVTLYDSLVKNCKNFILYTVCFDDKTFEILSKMNYTNLKPISLNDFESNYPELKNVKHTRKVGEYCWTSTAFTIKYCLEVLKLANVTYLDSDLYFLQSPEVIFNTIPSDKNIAITKHNYSERHKINEKQSGTYCVQFMYFSNNESAKIVLNKWADQCIDWCYNYYDEQNDRFGDQKYLDNWHNYENVYVVENIAFAAGPWNMDKIAHISNEIVFYHFHDFKTIKNTLDLNRLAFMFHKKHKFFFSLYVIYIKNIIKTNNTICANYQITKLKINIFIVKLYLKSYNFIFFTKKIINRIFKLLNIK